MHFIWQVDLVGHFIWKLDLILWLFQMWSNWRHRSAMTSSPVTDSFKWWGISEHFIWQVDLVEHFIWKVDLILWLFQMGSHWRHRLGNSWSVVIGSFAWGVYLNLNTSSEYMSSYLMSMCTSSCSLHLTTTGGYIWQLICTLHLKIWTHIWCLCALYLVHFIFFTSSDNYWGGISDSLSGHFIWKYELISGLGLASQRSFLQKTN